MTNLSSYYRVDRQNRIIDVGGDWDDFALSNSADECHSSYVVGDGLLSHVSGEATRMWLEALLQLTRWGDEPVTRHYRCDAPNIRRRFKLTTTKEEARTVLVQHDLLVETRMPVRVDIRTAMPGERTVGRCSICNSVQNGPGWIDPFSLSVDQEYSVAHNVCPVCSTCSSTALARHGIAPSDLRARH